jgi:hypothetical protein
MARRRLPEREAAALRLQAQCGVGTTKKRTPAAGPAAIERSVSAMVAMTSWAGAHPEHLVALWVVGHRSTYQVDPVPELAGKNWLAAKSAARKLVEAEFGGAMEEAAEFVLWSWRREESREQWRRKNGGGFGRITWRMQFAARGLLTEYRIAVARKGGG